MSERKDIAAASPGVGKGYQPRATGAHVEPATAVRAGAEASSASSNAAGRSILSMLGKDVPVHESSSGAGLATRSKLSVAELFHLAQGKEMPPLPGSCGGPGTAAAENQARAGQGAMHQPRMFGMPGAPLAYSTDTAAAQQRQMDTAFMTAYEQVIMGYGQTGWPYSSHYDNYDNIDQCGTYGRTAVQGVAGVGRFGSMPSVAKAAPPTALPSATAADAAADEHEDNAECSQS